MINSYVPEGIPLDVLPNEKDQNLNQVMMVIRKRTNQIKVWRIHLVQKAQLQNAKKYCQTKQINN